jgi:UDP:flavonoid glycosyltransferase YjiC (YdhE family)
MSGALAQRHERTRYAVHVAGMSERFRRAYQVASRSVCRGLHEARASIGAPGYAAPVRVLFTATPGWGHIHPMIPLARALVDGGDEVLWATAPDAAVRVESAGFRAQPAGMNERDGFAIVATDPDILALPPDQRPQRMGPKLFATVRAPVMLAELRPLAEAWDPQVMVCDALELAGPILATKLGVPNLTHSFGPLLPPERIAAMAEIVAPLWQRLGLQPRPYAGTYDNLYIDIYPPSLQPAERPHVSSSQLLQPVAFATGRDEPLPPWVTAEGPPLVYVTFGTVFTEATGLASIVSAVRDLEVRLIATVGPHIDPHELGPQPPNVHVASYIPQRQLLPCCSAVVSHGGSGTFLATIAAGVPQLCLPQGADQFLNAAAATQSGIGLSIPPDQATHDRVQSAVSQLLTEVSFTSAVEACRQEIATMPAPDTVAAELHTRYG